jgi:indole-3-glycerol phosphate synthase
MTILDQIIARKYHEVEENKASRPVSVLEKSGFLSEKPRSLLKALLRERSPGIISEFKRRSPSRGIINGHARAGEVSAGYAAAGSSAISVLTNTEFFGGSVSDLEEVRRSVDCPVLCKDFIIDEYQVMEARASGADAVLLISDINSPGRLDSLYRFTLSLGMEALIEVHNKECIPGIPPDATIIGINSRNLASFNVSTDHALEMATLLPQNVVKVAESGIRTVDDYFALRKAGFNAFLIGEYFMNSASPARTCKAFIENIRQDKRLSTESRHIPGQ